MVFLLEKLYKRILKEALYRNVQCFFMLFKGKVVQIEKIKCPNCGQTLCKLEYGKVEIKCTRCKKIITITKTTDIKTTEPRATP